jgi:hypothetical protein
MPAGGAAASICPRIGPTGVHGRRPIGGLLRIDRHDGGGGHPTVGSRRPPCVQRRARSMARSCARVDEGSEALITALLGRASRWVRAPTDYLAVGATRVNSITAAPRVGAIRGTEGHAIQNGAGWASLRVQFGRRQVRRVDQARWPATRRLNGPKSSGTMMKSLAAQNDMFAASRHLDRVSAPCRRSGSSGPGTPR